MLILSWKARLAVITVRFTDVPLNRTQRCSKYAMRFVTSGRTDSASASTSSAFKAKAGNVSDVVPRELRRSDSWIENAAACPRV